MRFHSGTKSMVMVCAMTDLDDLRYPIGRFSPPASSLPGIRAAQIQTLRLLPERLRAAVAGLNDAQLDTPYREGGWTVRQVVHHLADSHAVAYIRCKLALTEDWPTINPYDEAAWAELADSRLLPVEVSLALIEGLHGCAGLRCWKRSPTRSSARAITTRSGAKENLAKALAMYDWHSRHHTAHITSLRARQGW
jgi:hypothetical protein